MVLIIHTPAATPPPEIENLASYSCKIDRSPAKHTGSSDGYLSAGVDASGLWARLTEYLHECRIGNKRGEVTDSCAKSVLLKAFLLDSDWEQHLSKAVVKHEWLTMNEILETDNVRRKEFPEVFRAAFSKSEDVSIHLLKDLDDSKLGLLWEYAQRFEHLVVEVENSNT